MRRKLAFVAVAAVVVVGAAIAADTFVLTVTNENSQNITFSYPQQPGYGYLYSVNGTVVSRTNDPAKTTVKFSKANSYEVAAIVKGTTGSYQTTPPPPQPACSDTVDNDGDGKIDFPADPGCTSSSDTSEVDPAPQPACSDGVDNDGDGKIDLADPGCSSATDTDETDPVTPPPTGYPDASNTGVPSGTVLTAYTGPSNITTANTVIDSKTVSTCLEINATGVVIRNSRIAAGDCIYVVSVDDRLTTQTAVTIEDSEISCLDRESGAAVGEADFTVRRIEITHCENGFDLNQNILVEDSFIHDLYTTSYNHMDGAQEGCGHWDPGFSGTSCATGYAPGTLNITFRHNTIYAVSASGEFGTSAYISNRYPNQDHNVLIENNLLAGGAYTLYCQQDGQTGDNYRVINNHFSTRFKSTVGFYGISAHCSDEIQSGNVIHETGQPIFLE